jgi:hypothetical protein
MKTPEDFSRAIGPVHHVTVMEIFKGLLVLYVALWFRE